jgi:hypothetical protein
MIPKKPAADCGVVPVSRLREALECSFVWLDASAGEGRSEEIMIHQYDGRCRGSGRIDDQRKARVRAIFARSHSRRFRGEADMHRRAKPAGSVENQALPAR